MRIRSVVANLYANLGLKVLAVVIALFLWLVARGSSSVERGFDIPIAMTGLPDDLVVTERGADVVNLRVQGTRVALRNLDPEKLAYEINLAGAKAGRADYEVDVTRLELPRGARVVSRSPSQIELTFERRATRPVRVRADIEGQPAAGYKIGKVEIDPPRVRISGARSQVLRLSEVVTETIDVTGATQPLEKDVRVFVGAGTVWAEDTGTVRVKVGVEPVAPPAPPPSPA